MEITLTSWGAAQEVTGSCHLIEFQDKQVLLDCGLHQGGDAVKRLRGEHFDFTPGEIDAVILSHAHLDHSGLLPKLVRQGFSGPVYCSPASLNLLAILLEDAAKIYFRDLEGRNIRRKRSGRKEEQAEYSMDDVLKVLDQCVTLDYHHSEMLFDQLQLRFLDAGHILGSAIVELQFPNANPAKTLVFSGDLGNPSSVLMRTPEIPEKADLVLMESTYGDRDHRPMQDTVNEFEQVVETARKDKGVILMPAFSVGRTQELLYHLGCMHHQGKLGGWQVFIDSPMAIEVTHLYDQWLDTLAKKERAAMEHYGARSLEEFLPVLTATPSTEESIRINRIESGAIILAGSGMCNGGRIRHHFKHRIWKDNTHIIFAGYQAGGTLGRQLVDGARSIRMFGQRYAVHAQVHTIGGFSAHAGQTELLEWANQLPDSAHFRLVHGEPGAQQTLKQKLEQAGKQVSIAEAGVTISL